MDIQITTNTGTSVLLTNVQPTDSIDLSVDNTEIKIAAERSTRPEPA